MASVDISRGGQPGKAAAEAPAVAHAQRRQQKKRPLGLTSGGDVCARPVAGAPGAAVVAGGGWLPAHRFKASGAACLNGGRAACFKAALNKENAASEMCKRIEDSRLAGFETSKTA